MTDLEKWKPVVGFDDYEVSNFGRVMSWKPYRGKPGPRILKTNPDKDGYSILTLRRDGKDVTVKVHDLVLRAFRGAPPPGHVARHYPDATKSNNRLDNLSWATQKQNIADKREHGTALSGERHWTKTRPELIPSGSKHWKKKPGAVPQHRAGGRFARQA